jgi:hypothetical protein
MAVLFRIASEGVALALHALAVPFIFSFVAWHYFRARGARSGVSTALTFVAIVTLLDVVVVAGLVTRSLAMFGSVIGTWLPLASIFVVTCSTRFVMWVASAMRQMGEAR